MPRTASEPERLSDERGDRDVRAFSPDDVRTIRALSDTFIPGDDVWPRGSTVEVERHLGDTASTEEDLGAFLQHELRALDTLANQLAGHATFADGTAAERESAVKAVEGARPQAVRRLMELVYEAYYQHPAVHKAMASRTGYHFQRSLHGVSRSSTDEILSLLAEQADRDRRVRSVRDV